jgi:hypothetical protein
MKIKFESRHLDSYKTIGSMYLTQIGTKTKKTALYLLGKPRTKDEICVKYTLPKTISLGQPLSHVVK